MKIKSSKKNLKNKAYCLKTWTGADNSSSYIFQTR